MVIRKIAIGAVVKEIGVNFTRNLAERLHFGARVADPKRIVRIDQIDDPGIAISIVAQLIRGETIPRGGS